jgi:phosphoenolpyruvate phosphomutase
MYQQKVVLDQVARESEIEGRQADGRWVGMMRVTGKGGAHLRSALETLKQEKDFSALGMPDLLNQLIKDGHAPQVQYVNGHWMDINNLADLERAGAFEHTQDD